MKNVRLPYLILAVLAIPLAYLVFSLFERYEEEVDLGWSFEARRNPYLAAEQFLQQKADETEVESSYQLNVVSELSPDTTLFISDANAVLNERRADALVEWMQQGGHIIIGARVLPEGQRDVFLEQFGISAYTERSGIQLFNLNDDDSEREEDDGEEDKRLSEILLEENEKLRETRTREQERERLKAEGKLDTVADELAFQEQAFADDRIMRLHFDDMEGPVNVLLNQDTYLRHPAINRDEFEEFDSDEFYEIDYTPFYWEGTETGIGYMQFDVGDGLLTVVSDPTIWTSDRIGLFDHAYLLSLLTESSQRVVFLYGAVVPGLFDLLWQNFFELCIVLLLILALWLVYRARRFGPILDTSDLGRRSFREHLSAVGDFFWRHQQRDNLLDAVREAIWNELRSKHFAVRGFDEKEKLAKLGELVNEPPAQLREVMTGPAPRDEFAFFQRVKSLQKIRKQL